MTRGAIRTLFDTPLPVVFREIRELSAAWSPRLRGYYAERLLRALFNPRTSMRRQAEIERALRKLLGRDYRERIEEFARKRALRRARGTIFE